MIENISYYINNITDPYYNLALEEYLLKHVKVNECILYLWQNQKTVVIGRNQNPWKECKTMELERDGGKLARRLSGGGAVFHDLGNLNFTFLARKPNYDVDKQMVVILHAVNRLGIPAIKSGRNDITVEGRKFSGNAFYSDGIRCYHHGTILVDVDMQNLSQYLNVSRDKLQSKGVSSVKSRVVNLRNYNENLTIAKMVEVLIDSFGIIFGLNPEPLKEKNIDNIEIEILRKKFSTWDVIYGRKLEFDYSISDRFLWGSIEIQLEVKSGIITNCMIYSDSLHTELIDKLSITLKDCPFSTIYIEKVLKEMSFNQEEDAMVSDVLSLIRKEGI